MPEENANPRVAPSSSAICISSKSASGVTATGVVVRTVSRRRRLRESRRLIQRRSRGAEGILDRTLGMHETRATPHEEEEEEDDAEEGGSTLAARS